jgi:hypothetical protein
MGTGPDSLKIGLYERPPEVGALHEGDSRFQTLEWLPGQMPDSAVLWYCVALGIKRIGRGQTKLTVLA